MDLWRIAVRVLVAYLYLLATTRADGKRILTQATPFDMLVSLIVGDLIDDALWAEVSMAKFAAGAGSIFLCDAIGKVAGAHSPRIFVLLNGAPRPVLRNGREDRDALRQEQLNEADLTHLLRLDGIEDRSRVQLAVIELDHEASVLLRPEHEPAQKKHADKAKELLE